MTIKDVGADAGEGKKSKRAKARAKAALAKKAAKEQAAQQAAQNPGPVILSVPVPPKQQKGEKGGGKGGKGKPLSEQLCYRWSRDAEGCSNPCPHGRAHPNCQKCGASHPWAHPCGR